MNRNAISPARFLAALVLAFAGAACAKPAPSAFAVERQQSSESASSSDVVATAVGLLGVPYRRGGNSAETGFDCSGFVRAAYNETLGHLLPRRAEEQAAATQKIKRADLRPGDLVFFRTSRRTYSHVGIYVGDGKFIHAPKPGARVRIEKMSVNYWQRRFTGARRVQLA